MNLIHFFTLGFRPNYLIEGLIIGIVIAIYAFFRLSSLFSYYNMSKKNSLILRVLISIFIIICSCNVQSTATILIAYLFGVSIVVDIFGTVYKLISGKWLKIHKNGLLVAVLFILIVAFSVYGLNDIQQTDYNITTDKTNESYTILYISDLHYDTIQNPNLLKENIAKMNDIHPDIIVLGGDIADERTSKESMKEAFKELGKLNSSYGTYFVYGNHDEQPNERDYIDGTKPYTNNELISAIEDNGIVILEDSKVKINNDLILIGRDDAGHGNTNQREDVKDLLKTSDLSKFIIVLDHQPLDEVNNSKLGCDLQIAGHTHGGQIFPYGLVTDIQGKANYGVYSFGEMKEIVSSGFCGWGIPLRNENPCEYVVIHIN
ncbi:MAG: metallophosphoesterase [Methanobacteriaceae archaeon]|nr:metallophosphoesterase [Methanobacteriaceae archaeon]